MQTLATLKQLATEEEGQGLTEYALMFGFIIFGVWVLVNVGGLGGDITQLFSRVTAEVVVIQ